MYDFGVTVYIPVIVKLENPSCLLSSHSLPVRPWWRTDERGQVVFFVQVGWKAIEFERGKAGIVAGSMEKLPEVIDVLIGAVRAGELDPVLEQARTARPASKKKAA